MALHTQFHRKLDQLWKRQTENLRSLIKPKLGKPLAFTRATRNRLIAQLLELATQVLLRRSARSAFQDTYVKRRRFHLRGRGRLARGESLVTFAKSLSGPIVYAFWKGKRCLYVGKGKKPVRLLFHRKSYGREADSVVVYFVRARTFLPKAECLATHLFKPRDLAARPSREAWGKKCPICAQHDRIRRELSGLFAMR